MEQMLVEDLNADIEAARDKLRAVDDKIVVLSGRLPRHQRISYNDNDDQDTPLNAIDRRSFGLDDHRVTVTRDFRDRDGGTPQQRRESTGGLVRRRVVDREPIRDRGNIVRRSFDTAPVSLSALKRQRVDYLEDDDDYEEEASKRPKKTIQSTVVMPALDSRGRDEKIEKLKETENTEVTKRNRRMFSNLLMGTLKNFKKTEQKTVQQEKQAEVEKKLEEKKREDNDQRLQEKKELIGKRREQERELQTLQRKKALIQYADMKIKQLKLMRSTIQTTCGPKIFWQPVKHTVRSMELLQNTERIVDELIRKREDELANDLAARERKIAAGEDHDEEEEGEGAGEDEYDDDAVGVKNEEDEDDGEGIEVVVTSARSHSREVKVEKSRKEDVEENEEGDEDEEVHVELD